MKIFKIKCDGEYLKNMHGDIITSTREGAKHIADMYRCDISYNETEIVEIELCEESEVLDLLNRFIKLTANLNPDFPIEAHSGKMMELIAIQKQATELLDGVQ